MFKEWLSIIFIVTATLYLRSLVRKSIYRGVVVALAVVSIGGNAISNHDIFSTKYGVIPHHLT